MPPQSRGHNRLGSSYSTPNLAATEPFPPPLDPLKPPSKPPTTFSTGAPSEPVSPEDSDSRTPLASSPAAQQDYPLSDTISVSATDSEDEDGDGNAFLESSPPAQASVNGNVNAQTQYTQTQRPRSLYSYTSRSTTSLNNAPHATLFAPPFYNRPPTPLPPSPSLTSLLRPLPTFSTHTTSALTSRPTTPDSSDTEALTPTGSTTAASAITRSARTATTVPRASPKVPTYEYYGFVLYLGSSAAFLMYLLWSYLPTPFLHRLGIYYYPDRWWSLAVPGWLVMALVWIYVALASWNVQYETVGVGGLEAFVDEKGQVAVVDRAGRIVRGEGRIKVGRGAGGGTTAGVKGRSALGGGTPGFGKMVEGGGYGRLGIGAQQPTTRQQHHHYGHGQQKRDAANAAAPLEDLDWKTLWNYGTDAVMDVPIGGVCEILYGRDRDGEVT